MLSDTERKLLKAQHKHERDGRVRDRIKAVLLHDKGWSPQQIAEALFITDQAVRNHLNDYETDRKLQSTSGGSQEKLASEQSDALQAHLHKHVYLYVKDIVAYVVATFQVDLATFFWTVRTRFFKNLTFASSPRAILRARSRCLY